MPPRGWKRAKPLTSDDYASSIALCESAARVLTVVAQKHQDLPCLLATLTFAEQVVEKLRERKAQVDPHQVGEGPPQGTPDGDRPGEARS